MRADTIGLEAEDEAEREEKVEYELAGEVEEEEKQEGGAG